MKFSIFFEIEVLPQQYSESEAIENCLKQIELADQLGFDAAWAVEHHFTYEYSHSTAPEMFFAAAAQRTERIRLGPGVCLLPFHHPIHVAQRYAWLDILSKGRLNMGVGRGVTYLEYETFRPGVFKDHHLESREMFYEWIDIIREAWTNNTIEWKGKYISFPEIQPLPKPLQKPYPPMYAAAGSPDSFVLYPQKGLNVLGQAAVKPLFMALEDAKVFHKSWKEAGNDPEKGEFCLLWGAYCAPTVEQAVKDAEGPVMWYISRLQRFFGPRQTDTETRNKLRGYDWWTDPTMDKMLANDMVLGGDPDRCIQLIKKAEAGGVNHVLGQFQIGGLRHEQTVASMKLFAKEVMPAFKKTTAKAA